MKPTASVPAGDPQSVADCLTHRRWLWYSQQKMQWLSFTFQCISRVALPLTNRAGLERPLVMALLRYPPFLLPFLHQCIARSSVANTPCVRSSSAIRCGHVTQLPLCTCHIEIARTQSSERSDSVSRHPPAGGPTNRQSLGLRSAPKPSRF